MMDWRGKGEMVMMNALSLNRSMKDPDINALTGQGVLFGCRQQARFHLLN